MSMERIMQEEARLTILKELKAQPNQAATSEAMRRFLLDFLLIDKSREWVEEQFCFLAEMRAIDVVEAGSVKIARLTERGELHLQGRISIAGIQRPRGA